MTETVTALLAAHTLAVFLIRDGHPLPLALLHTALFALLAPAALGGWHPVLAPLTLVHLAIGAGVALAPAKRRLWPFLAGLAATGMALVVAAALEPGLWTSGLWRGQGWLPGCMAVLAGGILATRAGGIAVALLLAPFVDTASADSLPKGGSLIGLLERGLILLMVLAGQPMGIGFLIAAKSILRFDSANRDDRMASEYIIIGTLASFGWAMAVAWATLALLSALPPIGIPAGSP